VTPVTFPVQITQIKLKGWAATPSPDTPGRSSEVNNLDPKCPQPLGFTFYGVQSARGGAEASLSIPLEIGE
jgi:hypothetical protein